MAKKSWIILGSTLGGVAVVSAVLVPVLLVPKIYNTNIRTFVQKYTPVRSNEGYGPLVGQHPSSKLLFFSFLYTYSIFLETQDATISNVKTNGLHNSLSGKLTMGEISYSINVSYSKNEVKVSGGEDASAKLNTNDYYVSNLSQIYYVLEGSESAFSSIYCPIWSPNGSGELVWS